MTWRQESPAGSRTLTGQRAEGSGSSMWCGVAGGVGGGKDLVEMVLVLLLV